MSNAEAGKLGRNALVYLIPSVFARGLNVLLAPILTLYLSPADYGIVGLASTFTLLFVVLLGLAIHGSVTRIHFECETPQERAVFYGTLLLFTIVVSGIGALLVEGAGLAGAFSFLRSVEFHPYLELALWTAYAQLFVGLRTAMLQAREQPQSVATLNACAVVLSTATTLTFVIGLNLGATGVLAAQLVAQACVAIYCVWSIARESILGFSRTRALQALTFSLPLMPHIAANWGLAVSDRLILERSVSTSELGVYALGYMFCTVATMVATAIADALSPAIVRLLRSDPTNPTVRMLGTLAIAAVGWACTGAAVLGGDAITLLTPPEYWGASRVVPWVVLGGAFQGAYLVVSQGTWFSMKTRLVPLVTGIAAGTNVVLNIIFVPRYGIMAAAVTTAVSYGLMVVLHDRLAAHLYPIAWDYRSWATVSFCALTCFFLSTATPLVATSALAAVWRASLAIVGYPLLLQLFGVVDIREVLHRRIR